MIKSRPKKTPLTKSQLFEGFRGSLEQAEELLSEACILYRHRRFSGAYTRGILALEELGKHKMFLYQAALLHTEEKVNWRQFWKAFYSHTAKIRAALHWALRATDYPLRNREEAIVFFGQVEEAAQSLDQRKQEGQYSDFLDDAFVVPDSDGFRLECRALMRLVKDLGDYHRASYPSDLSLEEFLQVLEAKTQFAKALGYIGPVSEDDFLEAITHAYTPVYTETGELPSDEVFLVRVQGRYEFIPKCIPVTLHALNSSEEFREFYTSIKSEYGYPDWVILGVVYNIALNARVDVKACLGGKELPLGPYGWEEELDATPLPVELFTDSRAFECFLDAWLTAFLAGLGILFDKSEQIELRKVRRVAAHYYGVFHRDVKHQPVFHFRGLGRRRRNGAA